MDKVNKTNPAYTLLQNCSSRKKITNIFPESYNFAASTYSYGIFIIKCSENVFNEINSYVCLRVFRVLYNSCKNDVTTVDILILNLV